MLQLTAGSTMLDEALSSNVVLELQVVIRNWRTSMMEHRTAKIWFMYMSMVKILRTFLKGSCTGIWNLYIQHLREILPNLAASEHHNYVKSLVLYVG